MAELENIYRELSKDLSKRSELISQQCTENIDMKFAMEKFNLMMMECGKMKRMWNTKETQNILTMNGSLYICVRMLTGYI